MQAIAFERSLKLQLVQCSGDFRAVGFQFDPGGGESSPNRTRWKFHWPLTSAAKATNGRKATSIALIMKLIRTRERMVPSDQDSCVSYFGNAAASMPGRIRSAFL